MKAMIKRRIHKKIRIGNIHIGGNAPVAIQSMTKTATKNIDETIKQIGELTKAGCEIVRMSVLDTQDARAIKKIKPHVKIPLVADIHFNWQLALEAIDSGIDKIRLNPGNIYRDNEVQEIVKAAKAARIPIRVGVNSGSTPPARMVESALDYIKKIEKLGFTDIVISLKAADIFDTIEAYRKISEKCSYPLHLGLTATGASSHGAVKSSIALGIMLSEGLGDTIRVSLTDTPVEEVKIARYILESLGLRNFGPEIISCPTCGRCSVDLVNIVKELENKLMTYDLRHTTSPMKLAKPLKVAVMGCAVNGPGEARQADVGVAFEKQSLGLMFRKGLPVKKIAASECIDALLKELR